MISLLIRTTLVAFSVSISFAYTVRTANAAQVFFGEDINTTATGDYENASRILSPNADQAKFMFLSKLQNVKTETFESFTPNSSISQLNFGFNTAYLSSSLTVLSIPTGNANGVYPTSGNQTLLQTIGDTNNAFSVIFNTQQVAFGFSATDIEIPGNLNLRFLLADGISTIDRLVPTQAGMNGTNNTGSVVYYGVIDPENPFIQVSFIRSLIPYDGFGFDDMTIGEMENVISVPEPTNLMGITFVASLLLGCFGRSERFKFGLKWLKKRLNG